ncbi:MAG: RNA 2',3'-cyclic phosphodiesterase [Kiritimatiellaeota bacterium]|nr:RNA 2',3'-cyclic phosphodiesterase [Kiritimatiellota bacterium]
MNTPLEPTPDARPIRTFMAAAISEAVRGKLTEIQARLKQADADVGWVAPANIHLTILFLGTVFESQASALATATDGITAGYQPCTLEVKGMGYFGRAQSPRVIWTGLTGNRLTGDRLTGDLQPLLALQTAIAAAAKKEGIYTDAKPFHPHLTIGRVRSARNVGALLTVLETCRDTAFGTTTIDRVLLMKSELAARGPIYTILHESRCALPKSAAS